MQAAQTAEKQREPDGQHAGQAEAGGLGRGPGAGDTKVWQNGTRMAEDRQHGSS